MESYIVSDCDGKTYGFGCKENCGKCRGGAQCNHVTGTCQNGCDPGVYGDRCDKGTISLTEESFERYF